MTRDPRAEELLRRVLDMMEELEGIYSERGVPVVGWNGLRERIRTLIETGSQGEPEWVWRVTCATGQDLLVVAREFTDKTENHALALATKYFSRDRITTIERARIGPWESVDERDGAM